MIEATPVLLAPASKVSATTRLLVGITSRSSPRYLAVTVQAEGSAAGGLGVDREGVGFVVGGGDGGRGVGVVDGSTVVDGVEVVVLGVADDLGVGGAVAVVALGGAVGLGLGVRAPGPAGAQAVSATAAAMTAHHAARIPDITASSPASRRQRAAAAGCGARITGRASPHAGPVWNAQPSTASAKGSTAGTPV
jgi:hypothetical protein